MTEKNKLANLFRSLDYYFDDDIPEDHNPGVQTMARNHFMSLDGAELDFFGADAADNTFKVDNIVFKVLEDPDDGYRSYLGTVDYSSKHTSLFFCAPISTVKISNYTKVKETEDFEQGYRLIDIIDHHVWLEFGTANMDDYYPYFVFRYYPKELP